MSKTPVKRTTKQEAAAAKRKARTAAEKALTDAQTKQKQRAAQLAQIVNLHIAGFSLADIGASIGATAEEVDRMLQEDTARYVRTQPALRTYVRNYLSGKINELIAADWEEATDRDHPSKLENQDRVLRMIDRLAKLHGADAPVQSEVKVEAQPEAVEKMVEVLSRAQGVMYDDSVFDIVEAEIIHDDLDNSIQEVVSGNDEVEVDDGSEPI